MFTGISDAKQACIEIYCLSTVPGLEMVYLLKNTDLYRAKKAKLP